MLSTDNESNELVLIDILNHKQAIFRDKIQEGKLFHAAMTLRLLEQADCVESSTRRTLETDSCTPPNLSNLNWYGPLLVTEDMTIATESQSKIAPDLIVANAANEATTAWFKFDSSDIEVQITVSTNGAAESNVMYPARPSDPIKTATGGTLSYNAMVHHESGYVGELVWQHEDRTLSWHLEGITEGWVDDSRIPGGMRFDPSLRWAASQSYLFWLNRDLYAEIGMEPMYRFPNDESDTSSQINLEGITPGDSPPDVISLHRGDKCDNEDWYDGCSGLHWLDDTFFRPCCDTHDHCFRHPNDPSADCGWKSWIFFWKRWDCTWCNVKVVACFVSFSAADFGHKCGQHEDDGSGSGSDSDSGGNG